MAKLEILGERWLLLGPPKTGKSHLAASFPEPLFLNGDGAMNKYVVPKERRKDISSLEDLKEQMAWARANHAFWRTLVLDPLDKIVIWIDREICRAKGEASVGDIPHGAGWSRQTSMFCDIIDGFFATAESNPRLAASIIVAHSKNVVDGHSLVIRQALHTKVQGDVNNIAYVSKRREKDESGAKMVYLADLSGTDHTEAGCRNSTLMSAGIVKNPSWNAFCDLFLEKAYAWLESKGGITRKQFLDVMEKRNVTSREDLYDVLRNAKDDPSTLEGIRKMIEE